MWRGKHSSLLLRLNDGNQNNSAMKSGKTYNDCDSRFSFPLPFTFVASFAFLESLD